MMFTSPSIECFLIFINKWTPGLSQCYNLCSTARVLCSNDLRFQPVLFHVLNQFVISNHVLNKFVLSKHDLNQVVLSKHVLNQLVISNNVLNQLVLSKHVYVSQRSQIQFEDEEHAVYMSFFWVTTTLSSLRTSTCDALIVPSGQSMF